MLSGYRIMSRAHLKRFIVITLCIAAWLFLALSLLSFSPSDWPSHDVYPYPPTHNLCGTVGAAAAYLGFLVIGQGIYPLFLFATAGLYCFITQKTLSDLYLRIAGAVLLCVSFAALYHSLLSGSSSGLPEGYGGVIGIGISTYLHDHFNVVGTRLILLTTMVLGVLLAADDLVLIVGRLTAIAINHAREHTPSLAGIGKMPGTNLLNKRVKRKTAVENLDEKDDGPLKPAVVLKKSVAAKAGVKAAEDDEEVKTPIAEATVEAPEKAEASDEETVAEPVAETTAENADQEEIQAEQAPTPKRDIIVRLPSQIAPRQVSPPPPTPKELGEYTLPNWAFLADAEHGYAESQEKFVREKAAILEQALREFNILASVVQIDTGPVITMYEISLAPGIKVSAITALANDIARALAATSVRIVAPVPGKHTVGIEVPNAEKEKVRLKELMQLAPDATAKQTIPLYLGKDASGEPLIADLAAMPHCLIAGTTGSGKSVCINTIIMSIMYKQRPDMVKLILVDPKVVEMAPFKEIPHLMCPVINDCGRANSVLEWAVTKMDERYELLAEAGVRNIAGYNKLTREEIMERFKPGTDEEAAKIPKHLPYIVIIIDELADLMMTSGKEVEAFIVRLAQKSRAVGIHLILATQRPQATVVTGLIKSNMPSRIAFRVQARMDSRIVLDQNGADLLLGQGDMLFLPPGANKPIRAQGTYIDDAEIRNSVKMTRELAEAQYEPELVQIKAKASLDGEMQEDELFDDAVRVVLETKRGSVSLLQRRLTIGYGRAARLIEMMATAGILGDYKGTQARECTITLEEWEAMQAAQQKDAQEGMTV
jgi:S-DNA-T family DNA segregation ATPase FtsK/SpoIIIE